MEPGSCFILVGEVSPFGLIGSGGNQNLNFKLMENLSIAFAEWLRENDYHPSDKSDKPHWIQLGIKTGWLQPGMSIVKPTRLLWMQFINERVEKGLPVDKKSPFMRTIFIKLFILIALLLWMAATIALTLTIIGLLTFIVTDWGDIGEKLIDKLVS